MFSILLIIIGLCETSLRIENSFGTDFTDYTEIIILHPKATGKNDK